MSRPDKATIRQASAWFARMHAPDADDDRAAFDAWMAADESHRDAFSRVSEAFSLGKNLSAGSTCTEGDGARRRRVSAVAVMVFAASIVTVLAGRELVNGVDGPPSTSAGPPMRTRVGQIRTIRLQDGSTVTLDTDSQLATRFGARRRDLWLVRGRARFDVAHEARAFVVHAAGGSVTAHGTVFDVRVRGDDFSVRLIRGAIDVRSPPRAGRSPEVRRVTPGEAVTFDGAAGLTLLPPTRSAGIMQPTWPKALLDFDAVRVGDLATEANRYSVAHLVVSDPRVADMRVSGTFRVGDPVRLADRLAALLDLHVTRRSDGDAVLTAAEP